MGSIPAHAGEPLFARVRVGFVRVYPRARGGAKLRIVQGRGRGGLSPRTRGSRVRTVRYSRRGRSIPAHAGEPSSRPALPASTAVYPRARGGASHACRACRSVSGLSPRTRGSHQRPAKWSSTVWSIPAHAGEPVQGRGLLRLDKVYPRARGGAPAVIASRDIVTGLSPRTRGSPRVHAPLRLEPRSIPAHAGEPSGSGRCIRF